MRKTNGERFCRHLFLGVLIMSAIFLPIRGPAEAEAAMPGQKKTSCSMTLLKGSTYRIKMSGRGKIKWTSSRRKVAVVDKKCRIRAVACGKSLIKITRGDCCQLIRLRVVSGKLNVRKKTIKAGTGFRLKLKGSGKVSRWSSSKPSVASVSSRGKVTGRKSGKAVITARVGASKLKCQVTVKGKLSGRKETEKASDAQESLETYSCSSINEKGEEKSSEDGEESDPGGPEEETTAPSLKYSYQITLLNDPGLHLYTYGDIPCTLLWYIRTENDKAENIRLAFGSSDGARILTQRFSDVRYRDYEADPGNLKKVRGGWLVCASYAKAGTKTLQVYERVPGLEESCGGWPPGSSSELLGAKKQVQVQDGSSARDAWVQSVLEELGDQVTGGSVSERACVIRDKIRKDFSYARSSSLSSLGDIKFTFDVGPVWETKTDLTCNGAAMILEWFFKACHIPYRDASDSDHSMLQILQDGTYIDCDATPDISTGIVDFSWEYADR